MRGLRTLITLWHVKNVLALPSTFAFLACEKTMLSINTLLFISVRISFSLHIQYNLLIRDIQIDHCPMMVWQTIHKLIRRERQREDVERTLNAHNVSNRTDSTSATLPFDSTLPTVFPHECLAKSQTSIEIQVDYPHRNFTERHSTSVKHVHWDDQLVTHGISAQSQASIESPIDHPRRNSTEHNSTSVKHVHWHDHSGDHTVAKDLDPRTDKETASNTIQPSSAIASVQLCPHDTLRFERARGLAEFIGCGSRSRSHSALLYGRNGDHSASPHRLCKPVPGSPNLIRGDIQYHSSSPEYFYLRGLFVVSTWVFNLLDLEELDYNKKHFLDLLSQAGIELCPHQRLVDPWAFGEICNIAFPAKHGAQPSARHGGEERPCGSKLMCARCATTIRILDREFSIEIEVVRYLGKVKSEMDPLWWTQCRLAWE